MSSTIRFPEDLLERAERLDPEDRSSVIRRASELGLEMLEKEDDLRRARDIRAELVSLIESHPSLEKRIREVASSMMGSRSLANKRITRIAMVPTSRPYGKNGAFVDPNQFEVGKDGTLELTTPCLYFTYRPVGLKVWKDCEGEIEVSELRMDAGEGTNLMSRGWHTSASLDAAGSPIWCRESILPGSTVRLKVRGDLSRVFAVSLIIEAMSDWSASVNELALDSSLRGSGHLVRIPFVSDGPSSGGETPLKTPVLSANASFRIVRPLFVPLSGPELPLGLSFSDIKMSGSWDLLAGCDDGLSVRDAGPEQEIELRPCGTLAFSNRVYMRIRSLDEGYPLDLVRPYLLCELLEKHGSP